MNQVAIRDVAVRVGWPVAVAPVAVRVLHTVAGELFGHELYVERGDEVKAAAGGTR